MTDDQGSAHVIRLRGPWEFLPLERWTPSTANAAPVGRLPLPPGGNQRLPADWSTTLGADFRGRVRYLRRFNRPTNLAADERVTLLLADFDETAELSLNGVSLGSAAAADRPVRRDITALLRPSNELVIEVSLPARSPADELRLRGVRAGQAGGLIGTVQLEIGRGS